MHSNVRVHVNTTANLSSYLSVKRQTSVLFVVVSHMLHVCAIVQNVYRIYSRISRPAYKPTPIPTAENLAIISVPCISR